MTVADMQSRASMAEAFEVSRFLYDEAQLLDDMEWDAWLSCYHPDTLYWAPVRENRVYRERKFETYPRGTSAHFEETHIFLQQRVHRLKSQKAWAEEPASRSRHAVSNVRVDRTEDPGAYSVRSNFLVYRTRGERDQDLVAGERRDRIVRAPEAPYGFLIQERQVLFDMATILVKNLSLFY
ncbi:MAG TPA: aromatic-ring-hydroxylating dioxygenase subunit beta [Propionibacterium sp.]|jgi:biphenyl 2,3-dioxygenase beta subunit|nr:aromatic-ring-hydroxylating dioxygenase subunit beta [Propionibacterium sp.]